MSKKFRLGDKAPKQEAEKTLRVHAAAACDFRFTVRFENDDGGSVICLYIEVEEPSKALDTGIRDALVEPWWLGWRYVIVKVPIGYIDAVLEGKRWEE